MHDRRPVVSLVICMIGATSALSACTGGDDRGSAPNVVSPETASPSEASTDPCPTMEPGYIPPRLRHERDEVVDQAPKPPGVITIYESKDAKSGVVFWSGVGGAVQDHLDLTADVQDVEVRGHAAELYEAGREFVVVWEEAPNGEACSQYAIGTYGLPKQQVLAVLAAVE